MGRTISAYCIWMTGLRYEREGMACDKAILVKAEELEAAAYDMAASQPNSLATLREKVAERRSPQYTGSNNSLPNAMPQSEMVRRLAKAYMWDYAKGKWSLLSDKPSRPAAPAAQPQTCDA